MWSLWLGFFREHCASLILLLVLLPLTLFVNLQLGALLCVLVLCFAVLIATVVRRTHELQGQVREFHSSLAQHASDALGNLPVVQSFTRVEAELNSVRELGDRHDAAPQADDARLVEVDADDVIAEIREARTRDEPDVPSTDDR